MSNSRAYSFPGTVLSTDMIVKICANEYGVDSAKIYTKCQKQDVAESRGMAMFFMRKLFRLSHAKVGYPFLTDHSNVCYWVKKIPELVKVDKVTRKRFISAGHNMCLSGETINELMK